MNSYIREAVLAANAFLIGSYLAELL
jgi:hypothetical protein